MTKPKTTEQKQAPDRVEKRKVYLPCALTEKELKDYSDLMADAYRNRIRAEENLKSAQTQLKSDIAVAEGKIASCADKINSKQEYRDVECTVEFNFKSREKKIVRIDTGEVVRTEPISDDELQEKMPV